MNQREKNNPPDLDTRLAALSPEKRKLVELLQKQRASASAPEPQPPGPDAPVIDPERFSFVHDGLISPDQIQDFYNAVNRQLDASPFGAHAFFLNYGYVP